MSELLTTAVNAVQSFLSSHHMFTVDEWLLDCVSYFLEEGYSNITEIQNKTKEQWLLNNLSDICAGSLPANLCTLQKTTLNGCFVLQINAAVDVGTPAYQQYLKLQKVNMDNIEVTTKFDDRIPSHRMIKLYMTDGMQEITGIEYRPMRNLSLDITPGCKVLIKGPVECRRGVLLLTESSVELLGGEVQDLISNSQAFLLTSKLGISMSAETDFNATLSQPRNTNIPTPHNQMPPPIDIEPTSDTPFNHVTRTDNATHVNELNAEQTSVKRAIDEELRNPEKKLKINLPTSTNTVDDYPDLDMSFEDEDFVREMEAKFDAMENESNAYSSRSLIPISPEPYLYIKQIHDMSEQERAGGVFKVKAQILKLLSKLSVNRTGWTLRCTIIDGTGCFDVDFTSDVLSKLVGLTPQEMYRIKKQKANHPEMEKDLSLALQKARSSLEALYCLIELTILETPKITKLIPFENVHVDAIKSRLNASGM